MSLTTTTNNYSNIKTNQKSNSSSIATTIKIDPPKAAITELAIFHIKSQIIELQTILKDKTVVWLKAFNECIEKYFAADRTYPLKILHTDPETQKLLRKQAKDAKRPLCQQILDAKKQIVMEQDAHSYELLGRIRVLQCSLDILLDVNKCNSLGYVPIASEFFSHSICSKQWVEETQKNKAAAAGTTLNTMQMFHTSNLPMEIGLKKDELLLHKTTQKTIYVYAGSGVGPISLKAMLCALNQHVDKRHAIIETFTESTVPEFNVEKHVVVLTGGNFAQQSYGLNSQSKRIADFALTGNVLGSCAGALLVSKYVSKTTSGLFFERKAQGYIPIRSSGPMDSYEDYAENFLEMADIKMITTVQGTFASYYCQGPWFMNPELLPATHKEDHQTFATIANYSDHISFPRPNFAAEKYEETNPAAIVEWQNPVSSSSKKGTVILAGCHPETTAELLKSALEEHQKDWSESIKTRVKCVIQQLSGKYAIENNRQLFRLFLEKLNIPLSA